MESKGEPQEIPENIASLIDQINRHDPSFDTKRLGKVGTTTEQKIGLTKEIYKTAALDWLTMGKSPDEVLKIIQEMLDMQGSIKKEDIAK